MAFVKAVSTVTAAHSVPNDDALRRCMNVYSLFSNGAF